MRSRTHKIAGLFAIERPRRRYKRGSSAPPAPDPTATIRAQTQSNLDTANANRTNAVAPWGSSQWTQGPDGRWTMTQSLNPSGQRLFEGTQSTAESLLPLGTTLARQANDATARPFDFSGPNADVIGAGPQALNDRATQAAYRAQAGFLNPQWDQRQKDLEDQLSRQGIPIGSDAYNRALTNFNTGRTQAYNAAADTAVGQGIRGSENLFNLALLGQRERIGEQQLAQETPLRRLAALYGAA